MTATAMEPRTFADLGREPGWVARGDWAYSVDLMAVTGASYRQIDYWTRCGYILAEENHVGSGRSRRWDGVEQRVAEAMTRMIGVGIDVQTAALVARDAVALGINEYVHQGVTIKVMVVA